MKKRIFGIVIILAMIICLTGCGNKKQENEETTKNVTEDYNNSILDYEFKDDNTAKVKGIKKDKKEDTSIVNIPNTVSKDGKNYTVTSIVQNAFSNCTNLEKVNIPNSVKEIGHQAFSACSNLKSIDIPNSVEKIGYGTFMKCKNLENVKLSNNLKKIESTTFSECSNLKSIDIPNSVEEIGESAFSECISLETMVIPENVKTIRKLAFEKCTALSEITIPKTVTKLGAQIFAFSDNIVVKVEELSKAPEGWDSKWDNATYYTTNDKLNVVWNQ